MEIILVRHAKTEAKRGGLSDIRRNLKKKGKEEFQQLVPELKEKLKLLTDRKIILWSSPAVRAFETSHIISEELQHDIDAIKYFIYEGDFNALSQEVEDLSDETTLILVGHEPYLSEWTEKIADEDVEIETGDILSLKVTSQSPLKADLQWVLSSD